MQGPPSVETMARQFASLMRGEARAMAATLRAGGDAAWSAPTHCAKFDAQALLAHLIVAGRLLGGASRAAVERTAAPPAWDDANTTPREAAIVAQPREQVLALLEQTYQDWADYVESLDAAALARPVTLPFGTLPVWQVAGIGLDEVAVHHWDLRAPHVPDARISAETVPALVPIITGAMPTLGLGEKTPGTWQLDVEAPTGGPLTLRVTGDQVSVQPGPAPNADARLALDGDAFIRLIWGRLDLPAAIANGRVRVEGDRDRALALQRLFPGV